MLHEKIIKGSASRARSLRKMSTTPEKLLWRKIRDRKLCGLKFRRQVPIAPYVVDFFCAEKKLVVELDGVMHSLPREQTVDRHRDAFLMRKGITVLRIRNAHVVHAMGRVLEEITRTAGISLSLEGER